MPAKYECLNTNSQVIELCNINNELIAFYTKKEGINFLSIEDCKVKINLQHKYLNLDLNLVAFSPNGKYFAFYFRSNIYLFHIPTQKIILEIKPENEEIEIMSFDLSSKYLIAGTKNGRVLQYRYNSSTLLSRICSFPYNSHTSRVNIKENFVSAFAFFKTKIACTGYDGAIVIIDLISQTNKEVISHSRVRINALCFLDENTIISGNIDGAIQITYLNEKKAYKQVYAPFMKIKQIIVMPNTNFIMIHSGSNYTSVIDIQNLKVLHDRYLEFEDNIQKIELLKEKILVVALKNSKIFHIELSESEKLKSFILHNSIHKAYELIANEPMLKNSKDHMELESKYEKIYSIAAKELMNNRYESALQITNIFKNIPSKKEEIQLLFRAFEQYSKFKELYFNKKYTIAYSMCTKFPPLMQTKEYKQMEQTWKKHFANAQKEILLGRPESARGVLSEYITISSKRAMIQLILNDNKTFIEFLKAIDEKNFQKAYTLSLKNEIFTKIPSFKSLNDEIFSLIKKIEEYLYNGEFKLAKKDLLIIENIHAISKEIEDLKNRCIGGVKLQEAYEKNNLNSCYDILDNHKYLKDTKLGILLEDNYSKLIDECEIFSFKGDLKAIKNSLGKLIEISSRKEKTGNLLRVTFQAKINLLLSNSSLDNAESLIYTYIDIFGIDNEIRAVMHRFEITAAKKLDIIYDKHKRQDRDSWIHSKVIMG